MRYRRLGQTGLKLSTIGLGSWLTVDRHGQERANALHRRAYELGINFYDTANVYGAGETEAMVAEALSPFPRDTYVLATKVYFPMAGHPFPGANDRGLSRKHIFEQCERSLLELDTDYIDLYQCHRYDEETPLAETCRAMNDLIGMGRVLYWGVSQWTAAQIREAVRLCRANGWHQPFSDQPLYNLLQRSQEADVFPACEELGLGLVVFSPLAQGVLSGKYRKNAPPPSGSRAADDQQNQWMLDRMTPDTLTQVSAVADYAGELGVTPSQLALSWCLRLGNLASCIVGASTVEQVEENAAAADLDFGPDVWKKMESLVG